MIARRVIAIALALAFVLPLAACGTKTNLDLPNGKPAPKNERDPSRPPQPIGQ
jgi:predicted small lipoprotein YifL